MLGFRMLSSRYENSLPLLISPFGLSLASFHFDLLHMHRKNEAFLNAPSTWCSNAALFTILKLITYIFAYLCNFFSICFESSLLPQDVFPYFFIRISYNLYFFLNISIAISIKFFIFEVLVVIFIPDEFRYYFILRSLFLLCQ